MAAALECWSGRPSTDEDVAEQVLMPNPLRSNTTTSSPKKWHRLLQTLTSLKSSIIDEFKLNTIPIPIPKNQEQQQLPHQWGTLIRDLTHLYPGSQLPEKLISDLRRHFHSLPHSYALAAFPIKDTLLHLRLLHQSASSDQLAVHIQQLKDGREIHQITFACNHPISLPTVSTLLNVSCTTRNVQVFEKKGVTLGVVETQTLLVEEGQRETIKERVENALRSAMKKPVKKIPFGFCGCQEQEEDGLVRGDRIGVDEWQNVKTGTEEISRWILDSMEVEFGEQMGVSSFKGGYRGKKVWIRKMKGCERGSAYEVEIRHDLVRLMCCGHRNLVEFVGVCVEERYGFCVVTKMVEGGSVRDLIERRKVEGKEVVRIALDVAEGLMFMNGQGVAYRDLNVSRVLLDKQGNALLGDMGIVASCNNGGEVTEYETAGYRWLAPEIIAGDPESVTETWMSNVYSFGMVIWEMVTGEEAYSSYSPVQAAVGIAACGLRPEIPKDCPQVLRSLMIKCWNKCPSKRPQFSEIISILQKQNNR